MAHASARITRAEFPVLVCRILLSMNPDQAALALGRSPNTIKCQYSSILQKMAVPNLDSRIWLLREMLRDRFGVGGARPTIVWPPERLRLRTA